MNQIKAVVFDMDGVLFDTETLGMTIIPQIMEAMGYTITKDIMYQTLGRNQENEAYVFHQHIDENLDYALFTARKRELFNAHIKQYGIPMKPGVVEILEFLKNNRFKIALATSTNREVALGYLMSANIKQYFDAMICGDMITTGKPDPDIYLKAAALIDTDPGACIAVEDSMAGILSAYRAGMKPVMVPDILMPNEETKPLIYAQCDTLLDVIDILK